MLVLIVLTFVAPLVWMVLSSLKTNVDIYNPEAAFVFTPTTANYETVFGRFPGDYVDSAGTPILSWRVSLLPFLGAGQSHLVGKYKDTVAPGLRWLTLHADGRIETEVAWVRHTDDA